MFLDFLFVEKWEIPSKCSLTNRSFFGYFPSDLRDGYGQPSWFQMDVRSLTKRIVSNLPREWGWVGVKNQFFLPSSSYGKIGDCKHFIEISEFRGMDKIEGLSKKSLRSSKLLYKWRWIASTKLVHHSLIAIFSVTLSMTMITTMRIILQLWLWF